MSSICGTISECDGWSLGLWRWRIESLNRLCTCPVFDFSPYGQSLSILEKVTGTTAVVSIQDCVVSPQVSTILIISKYSIVLSASPRNSSSERQLLRSPPTASIVKTAIVRSWSTLKWNTPCFDSAFQGF